MKAIFEINCLNQMDKQMNCCIIYFSLHSCVW